jgi:hypothetical protein
VFKHSSSCSILWRTLEICLNIKDHHFNNRDSIFPRRWVSSFWDVTLCILAYVCRRFAKTCCLLPV